MTEKERDANQVVEEILRELRAQRQGTEMSPGDPPTPSAMKEPEQKAEPVLAPAAPAPKKQEEKKSEPVEKIAPAVEEIFPEPKLPRPKPHSSEDFIDDQFTKFFTQSFNDLPEPEPAPTEKKKGFFARLFGGRKDRDEDEYEEDYEEYDEDEEDYEEDDAETPVEPTPAQPEKKDLPKDLFAQAPEPQPAPAPQPAAPAEPAPPTSIPEPAAPQPRTEIRYFDSTTASAEPAAEPAQVQETPEPIPGSLYDGEEPEAVAASSGASIFTDTGFARAAQPTGFVDEPVQPIKTATPQADIRSPEQEIAEPSVFEDDEDEEEPLKDYENPADAEAVSADLRSLKASLSLRFTVTGLITVFLTYITLVKSYPSLPNLPLLSPTTQPLMYLLVCTALTGICLAVNWQTLTGGILSIVREPNPDIAPAFAGIFAAVQCLVFLTDPKRFAAGNYTMFCGVAALTLALNLLGKKLTARIVLDNFEMASSGFEHSAAYSIENEELLKKVTNGLGETEPHLLVTRPTALVKGFLRQSFSEHLSDKLAKWLGVAAIAASAVCGIAVLVMTKDGFSAVSCFAGAICLGAPLASTLVGAIPAGLMQSSAARVGAIIPGPSAVETLKRTNVVMMNAKDLFPTGHVALRGIKTFEKERIDLAILYAASILVEGCETLRDVFLEVVAGKREMLYQVENLTCETGRGFVGWIEGNRVIVGNREIMKQHDIEIPSMDYERKYTKDDRMPIYLAVSGKLFGMFLVSYLPAEEVQDTLDELRHSGISLLVRSTDFSISNELIARCYNVPLSDVKVLTEVELNALSPSLAYLPASEGVMTHIGTFASFIGGLQAALAAFTAERTAAIVEAASVILGIVLTLLLTFTAGLGRLSVFAVLLYQLAWLILTVAIPLLKKY